MKIKTKLRLGFGFLFFIVIAFGSISLYHINQIEKRSKVILKDNYKSLQYVNQMRAELDAQNGLLNEKNRTAFGLIIAAESKNITEKGEKEAVSNLQNSFERLKVVNLSKNENDLLQSEVRLQLRNIDEVNMKAIVRKNDDAQHATQRATLFLGATAFVCFLILFTFIVNFPSFIANPLSELLVGIREISRKNYKKHLHFEGNDEFNELASAFNKMANELNRWDNSNVAEIKSEKQRIETIIEQMQDAIIGLNEKQEILFFNKVAADLLNLDPLKVVGSNAVSLGEKNELLKKILNTNQTEEALKIYTNEKESYFVLEHREIIIPNNDDQLEAVLKTSTKTVGTVYVLKNITKFKELDEAKTNFIATVSHELKTPLSSIKMSLKLLDDQRIGDMNDEQKQLVTHIKEDSDRLLKITSELLDLAQVETGNLHLNLVRTKPETIIDFAIDAVNFQAQQKEIKLNVNIEGTVAMINADVQKTTWVLVNLLSNAMRYSSAKSVVIVGLSEKNGFVEFSVRDFGKGIEEQYLKRLFERYYQVPTDGQNKSGTGLGLAISKDFIEAEKGSIYVESSIGEGSKFSFLIPVAD
ncbi:HAMP domain-containing protein [Pedobacter changchengzhani]|uniref:histidine kinase n=1 Tax=Pedobacter changchengzhani TaxID=2529274 RepID=A0A4R5MNT9_9SPHI|nr:ATP-binding protein [Pedobacter changchengzhani]TDG36995.1 HAMP domain-containing protein [Pedobacter changchengzhani]